MTSPIPEPDYEKKTVMCCLCFGETPLSNLVRNSDGELIDVCRDCRRMEIRIRNARVCRMIEEVRDGKRTAEEVAEEIVRLFK